MLVISGFMELHHHGHNYLLSCSAANSKAVLKEKPYLQDMLGTLNDQMIF